MKLRSFLPTLLLCALSAISLTGCGGRKSTSTPTSGTMTLFCDNSFENIMEQEIDVFEFIYPQAHVLARYGTEAEAIDSFLSLNTRTIVIPRELTPQEKSVLEKKRRHPRSLKIAVDALALIINPENPADFLSLKEVSEILSGETANWQDLNPHFPDRPIQVVFDSAGSSMTTYMRDSLLDGKSLGSTARQTGSIQGVIDAVKNDKSAIGVIGVSWLTTDLRENTAMEDLSADLQNDSIVAADMGDIDSQIKNAGVKTLGVMRNDDRRAYWPYQQNIYDGTYPLTRSMYMITYAGSGSLAGGFYSFVTGYTGQKLIMKTGVMPARMNIQVIELVP